VGELHPLLHLVRTVVDGDERAAFEFIGGARERDVVRMNAGVFCEYLEIDVLWRTDVVSKIEIRHRGFKWSRSVAFEVFQCNQLKCEQMFVI